MGISLTHLKTNSEASVVRAKGWPRGKEGRYLRGGKSRKLYGCVSQFNEFGWVTMDASANGRLLQSSV